MPCDGSHEQEMTCQPDCRKGQEKIRPVFGHPEHANMKDQQDQDGEPADPAQPKITVQPNIPAGPASQAPPHLPRQDQAESDMEPQQGRCQPSQEDHGTAAGTDEQETAAEGMEQDDGRQGRCN